VTTSTAPSGITEAEIANFLANTPSFFERHAELLASIHLTSPHGARAVSLQERQMEMLRDRIKGFEHKIIELIRLGQENVAIADRLHRWTRHIMLVRHPRDLPSALVAELQREFLVPQAAIRVWGASDTFAAMPFMQGASDDVKTFASSLTQPYCGLNSGFEAVRWLADPASVMSLAMIPLRGDLQESSAFGLLVLGSPDATRYSADMGTEFLARIGEIASAGLHRLLPAS
jgi:uncharacterized protein YigA (DUF484 family)